MDLSNPTAEKLIKLVAQDERYHRRTGDDAALARFLSQYPKERIQFLSMEDYVLGKGAKPENFCWWLERGLERALGRYMPGTAKAHLLYRQPDGNLYKHAQLADLADAEALAYVLKLQSVFAAADPTLPLEWLDDRDEVLRRAGLEERMPMGEGRRLRLLSVYNVDTFLPIYSSEHIAHYLEALGVPASGIPPYQRVFARHKVLYDAYLSIRKKVPTLTTYGFVQALYSDSMGIRPIREPQPDVNEDDDPPDWPGEPWDAATVRSDLLAMGYGLEPGKNEPTYAFEHALGDGKYVYVKRGKNESVKKAPLVIHPSSVVVREHIDRIPDIRVRWNAPVKNTSYRTFPKRSKQSQHGYPVDVRSTSGLQALIALLKSRNNEYDHIVEADVDMDIQNSFSLNQILYGPPGTGKTYATTELAVKIAEPDLFHQIELEQSDELKRRLAIKELYDSLVNERRIAFTTFHQSFAYEDFIEGIRAQTDEGSPNISYAVEDGIFKQLAILASVERKTSSSTEVAFDIADRRIWKMSLGNTLKDEDDAYQDCIDNNYIGLGYGGEIDFTGCKDRHAVAKRFEEKTGIMPDGTSYNATSVNTFKNVMKKGDIVVVSDGNHKFRAIGEVTGDYEFTTDEARHFYQTRAARWLRVFETSLPKEALFQKSLSQMTLYELRPRTIKLDQLQAYLSTEAGGNSVPRNHVLIIDEINRGNIARIFGELITLLESDKRQGSSDARSVLLPYSKKEFSVPANLYVIGTMNTTDKSLAQLDLALRRRFTFTEVLPEPELLQDVIVHGISMADLLSTINDRIEVLLDRDHLIGHSYFWSLTRDGADKETLLAEIFENKLIPLLQEYFFADWERIRWVLNDLDKPREQQFIQLLQDTGSLGGLFSSKIAAELHDRRYRINQNALRDPAAYRGIISVGAP